MRSRTFSRTGRKGGEIGFGAWAIGARLRATSLHVWMRGLPLDDNPLGLDAFREVGPDKHYFGAAHTLPKDETALWKSAAADNNSFEQWRDEWMKDASRRASERWRRLLAEYEQPRLDLTVDEEINAFVSRRKAEPLDQWQ
jgi:trimethylamine---corrinoid protein Co-methyltransferase